MRPVADLGCVSSRFHEDFSTMTEKRPGQRSSIRFSDSDYDLFKAASELEGADNIVQWMVITARKRARLIAHKGAVRITEVVVPPPEDSSISKGQT